MTGPQAVLRRVKNRRRRKLKALPQPVPDFTGWTAEQVLMWAARNGKFEEMVAHANQGERRTMITPEENETELRAAGQWPTEGSAAAPGAAPPEPAPAPAAKLEPPAEPAYWEEKCRWRLRGPEDYDWDDSTGYQVEHEYDPLEDA